MKKTALCFALGLLFIYSVVAANKTDREHDGLIGQVSTVRFEKSISVNRSGQSVEGPRVLWQTVAYDSNGRVTERIFYVEDGNIWSKTASNYDSEGNRSDIVYRASVGGAAQASNVQNRSMKEFLRSKRTFKYDADGNRTEEADYTEGGALFQKTVYAFEGKGYVKEIVQYGSDGRIISRCVNEYGERGRIVKQSCYDSRGALSRKSSYSYEFDSTGNWVKRVDTTQSFYEGKQTYEAREVIYRSITYESQSSGQKGAAIDRSTDVTGGVAMGLTRPLILRKSGGLLQGSARRRVEPRYPDSALAQGIGGSVVVEVTVDEDGSVMTARALSGPDELRGAAVSAARDWKFHPTTLSGIPVKIIGTITFNFHP
jgi:TonB family protein